MEFIESGMTFGPFPEGDCFRVEKSLVYKQIEEGVKIAEFALIKETDGRVGELLIVEAKQSSPKPGNRLNFPAFIEEIRAKFENALNLTLACIVQRHPTSTAELSGKFKSLNLRETRVVLILIIKGHKKQWLPPLQDALRKELNTYVKVWNVAPSCITVINDETALEKRLIQREGTLRR